MKFVTVTVLFVAFIPLRRFRIGTPHIQRTSLFLEAHDDQHSHVIVCIDSIITLQTIRDPI